MGYLARAQLNNEVFPVNCSRCTPLSDGHSLAGYDAQCQLRQESLLRPLPLLVRKNVKPLSFGRLQAVQHLT